MFDFTESRPTYWIRPGVSTEVRAELLGYSTQPAMKYGTRGESQTWVWHYIVVPYIRCRCASQALKRAKRTHRVGPGGWSVWQDVYVP